MIIGVDHTGFIVTNIEESAHFYQNVIGLKLIDSFERKMFELFIYYIQN